MRLSREELCLVPKTNDESIITFVSTVNPRNPEIFSKIKQINIKTIAFANKDTLRIRK